MPNSNPQVKAFSNTRVRPMADRMFSLKLEAIAMLAEYNAGDIGTLISNAGPSEIIVDDSETDGRTQITGGDIFNIVGAVQDFILFVDNGAVPQVDRNTTITKPHVNRV